MLDFSIFDPTGNITALVESEVAVADQPAVAAKIMADEPDVEQVGFITYAEDDSDESVPVRLRMAGGEFCGNATMCAAALFAIRHGLQGSATVRVSVSGAAEPIPVALTRRAANDFEAAASMPPAVSVGMIDLLPLVRFEGIEHIIIEPGSGFFGLKDDRAAAETLIKEWCSALGSDCLGMMFVSDPCGAEGAAAAAEHITSEYGTSAAAVRAASECSTSAPACTRALTPLVYVPGADTMFWENSCASGTAAAGIYLAAKAGSPVDVTFTEPAGKLRVESDPESGLTILHGSVVPCMLTLT